MSDVNVWNSKEAFQFKECYDLAAQFEKLNTAKDVLREKSKRIEIPKDYFPVQEDVTYVETEMQIISEAIYELTLEGLDSSENSVFKYDYKINNLPSSAEKEYLLALLSLRYGTSETQRLNALNHISAAHSYSPNDHRYITLASVLQGIDK